MGGGGRYPFPKDVWSPSGGWWARPHNWKSNTIVAFAGILTMSYVVFRWSAEKEYRPVKPFRDIPSMMWTKQYRKEAEPES